MRIIRILQRRAGSIIRRSRAEAELGCEFEIHLKELTKQAIADGMSEAEARVMAARTFGALEQTKEECRDARGVTRLEEWARDLQFGVRMLRKSPGFSAVAILTLALGIGANAAIFSIANAVLLRSFPYPNSNELAFMFNVPQNRRDALSGISYRDFIEYRKHNRVFSEIAANAFHTLTLTGAGEPSVVNTADVTPEIFAVLKVKALAGRTLLPEDGSQGSRAVAVLSESLWRNRFASDPSIIGRSIDLERRPFTVVGILPARFTYPDGAPRQDVWISVLQDPLFGPLTKQPRVRLLAAIGRLKAGVSPAQAEAGLTVLGTQLAKEFPAEDSDLAIRIRPYREEVVGNVRPVLLILLGAVGLLLLMACANIANLLLSKATTRASEIALRVALGASRARIVQQLLTESLLLALLGGFCGVLLAFVAVSTMQSFVPAGITQIRSIHVEGPVLMFALLLSLLAALTFGLAPALIATASNLQTDIREGGQRTGERQGQRIRNALVAGEIALATLLLTAGGLLIRSFALVTSVNPGFDPQNVTTAEVSLPRFEYSDPRQWATFCDELLARVHAQPGLQDSAIAAPLPMDRQGQATFEFSIVGGPPVDRGKPTVADYATVSPEFFRVLRIPLLAGRLFSRQDSESNPKVAIISNALARRYFPGQDPISRHMKFGFPPNGDVSRQIVGVVGDVRNVALSRDPGPIMYVPFSQEPLNGGELVVRSSLGTAEVAASIRRTVHTLDKNLPVTDVRSFRDTLDQSTSPERFRTVLLGAFSALALVLAAAGIFGVVSYAVAQRAREIGVRVALGAQPREILRLILGYGAKIALVGLGVGVGFAFLVTRLMTAQLYRVSAVDPLTFTAVPLILLGVSIIAGYIPARRALRIDPAAALRCE